MAKVAVHLQCQNNSAALPAIFAMLKAQTFTDWQVYLLDNGSNAEEKVKIREYADVAGIPLAFFRVHPGIGIAAGNNFLFSRHDGEYIAVLKVGQVVSATYLCDAIAVMDADISLAVHDGVYRRSAILRASEDGSFFDASCLPGDEYSELASRFVAAGYVCEVVRPVSSFSERITAMLRNRFHAKRRKAWLRQLRRTAQVATSVHVDSHGKEYDIAVITVTHNDVCVEGLESIQRARAASSLRIATVFVDNGTVNYRANEFIHQHIPDAHVLLREKNYGFGHSCNLGTRQVKARYYFYLNPDTILNDEKIFDKMWQFMQTHSDAGIVAPKIFYFDGRLQETCRRFPAWYVPFVQRTGLRNTGFGKRYTSYFQMDDYDHAVTRAVDWAQGSALCVDAEVLRALGGFDQRFFMYFEDIDLCRRTALLGKKVYYCPEITLQHAHGKESARYSGFITNLVKNPMARAHIASWLKYVLKWGL